MNHELISAVALPFFIIEEHTEINGTQAQVRNIHI
jgi:hypothetical protein